MCLFLGSLLDSVMNKFIINNLIIIITIVIIIIISFVIIIIIIIIDINNIVSGVNNAPLLLNFTILYLESNI